MARHSPLVNVQVPAAAAPRAGAPVTGPQPRAYALPPAVRPATQGKKQTLGGFEVFVVPSQIEGVIGIDPMAKTVTVHPKTWSWFKNDNAVMGAFVHEKAEAVRLMKVTMFDASRYAPAADPKRQVAPVPMGITLLCRDLATLVGDMAAADVTDPAAIRDMARRYGKMRDTMATLRAAFAEAEGAFEVAQDLLVQKMGL